MSDAPYGNDTAIYIRNADDNYGIVIDDEGILYGMCCSTTTSVLDTPYYYWELGVDGKTDYTILDAIFAEKIRAIILPSLQANATNMLGTVENLITTTGLSPITTFDPVPLDTSISAAGERTTAEKRYYRRHDKPRLYFDQSITVSWSWNPLSFIFNALYNGGANMIAAPEGIQGISGEVRGTGIDETDTWAPRNTCFETNNPFVAGEYRGFEVRVIMGKMSNNWRGIVVEDCCINSCSDTPTIDDFAEQSVELMGTKFYFAGFGSSEDFPTPGIVWG